MRISEEISLMSRLSEDVSALFNFTLDDSLSLKKHYSSLLKYYSSMQNNNDLHHIIVGIHHILGDLHSLAEEYNEAIFEYQYCVNLLSKDYESIKDIERNNNPHYLSHILNIVRIMLKLCLVYEKRKTHNSAYITYNELIALLVKFRYINPEELGLSYKQRIKNHSTWKDRNDVIFWDNKNYWVKKVRQEQFYDNVQAKIEGNSEQINYEVNSEELIPQLHIQLTPEKNTLTNRLSLFEDISLVYQALLARLFVLEKKGLSGMTKENVDIVESDFLYLQRAVYYKEKYMIAADFFRKLADILYYKNGLINNESCNFLMSLYFYDYDLEKDLYEYFLENGYEKHDDIMKEISTMPFPREWKWGNEYGNEYVLSVKEDATKDFLRSDSFRKRLTDRGFVLNEKEDKIFCIKEGFGKVNDCQKRRKKLLVGYKPGNFNNINIFVKDKHIPCYACKYYNRSLKIIREKMIQSDIDYKNHLQSQAIFFIEKLGKKELFTSLKENDILTLAASLDGLGNTLFSCSYENDKITDNFIDGLLILINEDRNARKDNPKNGANLWFDKLSNLQLSNIEKTLLYYWGSAAYFRYSAKIKEALERYKKILHVFEAYLLMHQKNEETKKIVTKILDNLKKIIFEKATHLLYMQYENTNIVEVQNLKWIFTKQLYESIPLNLLSNFPDIEEMVIIFCRIEQLCDETESTKLMYKSMPLSQYRIEKTITERIVALHFKADMNMKIIYQLLKFKADFIYKAEFPQVFYKNYLAYLSNNKIELEKYENIFNKKHIENDTKTKIELIDFLIMDTMFALSKIIETISPTVQTTLFTESYMGDIYMQLFECYQIFDFIYIMYRWCDSKDIVQLEKKINGFIGHRIKKDIDDEHDLDATLKKSIENLRNIKQLKAIDEEKSKKFFEEVMEYIDKPDFQNNTTRYLLDMALWKYKRAIEMHHEGGAYQELMSKMYFLEDNLSNNTYQFYFAIERYYNNCGLLNERIKRLKKVRNVSSLFQMDKYT